MLNGSDVEKEATKIARKLGLPRELVHKIIMYEFYYIKQVMYDPNDYKDVLLNDLLRFGLKYKYRSNKMIDEENSKLKQNSNTTGLGGSESTEA